MLYDISAFYTDVLASRHKLFSRIGIQQYNEEVSKRRSNWPIQLEHRSDGGFLSVDNILNPAALHIDHLKTFEVNKIQYLNGTLAETTQSSIPSG